MRPLFFIALIVTTQYASAQDVSGRRCESLISLSKLGATQVDDKESVEEQANSFCKEYSKSQSTGSSTNVGGSYGPFAAKVGMTGQSSDAIASKYCSASTNYSSSKNAYKSYVDSIAPGAYAAYERCISLANNDIRFSVDPNAILPTELSLSISFVSRSGIPKTELDVSASKGVTCRTGRQPLADGILTLSNGRATSLTCKRTDSSQKSYITIVDTGSANLDPLIVPWPPTDAKGNPIAALEELQAKVASLASSISNIDFLSGEIQMKAVGTRPLADASSCPTGKDAIRGETNGRVIFTTPFRVAPTVSAGIVSMDMGGLPDPVQRISFHISSIDKNGFNYSFTTWCTTPIYGAMASWIAIAR